MNTQQACWLALVAATVVACGGSDDNDHAVATNANTNTPVSGNTTPASPTTTPVPAPAPATPPEANASAPSASASTPDAGASAPATSGLPFAIESTYVGFWHGAARAPNPEYNLGAMAITADTQDATGAFTATTRQTKSVAKACGSVELGGGQVSGTSTTTGLSGIWKDGTFNGGFDSTLKTLQIGVQDNAGDHVIQLGTCGTYFMPEVSQWTLAAPGVSQPASFTLSIKGAALSWTALPDGNAPADWAMLSVYDEDAKILRTIAPTALGVAPAGDTANDHLLIPGNVLSAPLAALGLVPGHRYILAVSAPYQPVGQSKGAYASLRYSAP